MCQVESAAPLVASLSALVRRGGEGRGGEAPALARRPLLSTASLHSSRREQVLLAFDEAIGRRAAAASHAPLSLLDARLCCADLSVARHAAVAAFRALATSSFEWEELAHEFKESVRLVRLRPRASEGEAWGLESVVSPRACGVPAPLS